MLTRAGARPRPFRGRIAGAARGSADGSSAGAGVAFLHGAPALLGQGVASATRVVVPGRSARRSLLKALQSEDSWDDILQGIYRNFTGTLQECARFYMTAT